MSWRESTEELAAESFGLMFAHIYIHTILYSVYTVCSFLVTPFVEQHYD